MQELFFLLAGDASTNNGAQANMCLSYDVLHPVLTKNVASESRLCARPEAQGMLV